MVFQVLHPSIPPFTWQRPIGLGWETPYTVRYASNLDDGPWHGMPLGGFGAGCIGRSSRGDFNFWHLDGGEHIFQSRPACQFSVFEQVGHRPSQAYALCTHPPANGSLSTWQWYPDSIISQGAEGMDETATDANSTGTYHALYPRSWFRYERIFQSQLTCEQFSPIWAGNYQETSYPVVVFAWTATNPTDEPITLSVMLTWENMVGWFTNTHQVPEVLIRDDGSPVYSYRPAWEQSEGNINRWVEGGDRVGFVLDKLAQSDPPAEGEGQMAMAALVDPSNTEVFYQGRWQPTGDGSEVWFPFCRDGSLSNQLDESPAGSNEAIGAALAVRFSLQPGETRQIPFALAWDLPVTEFATGITYYRRYTDFFGWDGGNGWAIASTALKHWQQWQSNIIKWQQPILDRDDLPNWFKSALFNELYILTAGGTLWSAADDRDPLGQFAVLECIDYRWYESLDVRLYGSFGLVMLWPELDKSVLRAFARAIPTSDARTRVIGYYYTQGVASPIAVRKAAGATPHDLGAPNEHPWEKTNYTSYQDCNLWKDLGSDFVLQVYRTFVLTGGNDYQFLQECWTGIVTTLTYLKTFDHDGDGIPENSGAPDQTFDDWRLQGVSAYCGGLWIAALEATAAIGEILKNGGLLNSDVYLTTPPEPFLWTVQEWLTQARPLYHQKLWNGQYYQLDSDSGSTIVMADQLCGQYYAHLLGLPDIVPMDCARIALQTVFNTCFIQFNEYLSSGQFRPQSYTSVQDARSAPPSTEGISQSLPPVMVRLPIGAANGVQLDGSPENPNATHPLEIWTGINFGLAAFLVQMDMKDEAMTLMAAVVQQIYDHGLQFRTPEAITAEGTFRACLYLRPMAIWAVLREFDAEGG